jgi:protein farnesyltransferase/geranylgeranyltransferase type-1 subunit alpha
MPTNNWFWSIAFSTLHLRAILHQLHIVQSLPKKKERMPKYYHDDDVWQDIEPLPQDDGGLHPLAAIAYTEEYSEAMGYLRAAMAKNEFSERVMGLTEHIISMNPAHYTVW